MNEQAQTGGGVLLRVVGIWAMIGVTTWSEAASFAAFCLTVYLILRHVWRDIVRPFLVFVGWARPRGASTSDDDETERHE
jgi:hypothetical protein